MKTLKQIYDSGQRLVSRYGRKFTIIGESKYLKDYLILEDHVGSLDTYHFDFDTFEAEPLSFECEAKLVGFSSQYMEIEYTNGEPKEMKGLDSQQKKFKITFTEIVEPEVEEPKPQTAETFSNEIPF